MKAGHLLLFLLLFRVVLGREEEEPGESDPDLQTIIIHSDSTQLLNKNFDDLEDSKWLENWNVPLIIANSDNGAKDAEVEKVQKKVKFLPGRFKNKKAVIHMKDESKMNQKAAGESVVESWIVGDKEALNGQGREKSNGKKTVKKTKGTGKKQKKASKAFTGPEDMEKDGNMHTIVIHSDTKAAQERYFDELEDSRAFDNWVVPRIITNAHTKPMRKQMQNFTKKKEMAFRGKFANKQAVIHVREDQHSTMNDPSVAPPDESNGSSDFPKTTNGSSEGSAISKDNETREREMPEDDQMHGSTTETETPEPATENNEEDEPGAEVNLTDAFYVAQFFNNVLGTIEYYWIMLSSDNVPDTEKPDAGEFVPWYFTSKTFVKTSNATYVFYKTLEDFEEVYISTKLNETLSMDEQWNRIQFNALKGADLYTYQYGNSLQRTPILMGFWNKTCEDMEWAINVKLTHSQNLAHICLLHELRRSRFKFYKPADAKDRNCTKDPLSCALSWEDRYDGGFEWHALMTVDGAHYRNATMKNYTYNPIFFSSAGGYERLVVGYFVLHPKQQTPKFNIFGGFLFAEALIAILAFGIIITALIFFSSGSTIQEIMFYMFAAVFEQGQRTPINNSDHGRRAFFGKIVCFLWLLSWLILRQFLSGALVSNLTREDPPNTPTNHDNLLQFLKQEGAILVEPLRRDENDWFQGSRDKFNKSGQCWKEDFVSYIFSNNTGKRVDLFPELKLMACIKSKTDPSDCDNFQNITVPYAFSYISTERRLETMKKLAKLVDKGIFVSTSNVETPFVKPNFFAPYGSNLLRPLLSKDFANYFESGIFQKWQKLDEEMEGLTACLTHATKQFPDKYGNKTDEQIKETRRYCRELLDQDKKSGVEWIRRQLGKIDPVKFKEIKFPLLILLSGQAIAFIVFLFEKLLPRRAVVWLNEKIGTLQNIFSGFRRMVRVYPQEFELSESLRQAQDIREKRDQVDDQEEENGENQTDNLPHDNQPKQRLSPTLDEAKEKRLQRLLEMIDNYDRLVFTDEDFALLQTSGVIMTDEEAEELTRTMRQNEVDPETPEEGSKEEEVHEMQVVEGHVPEIKVTEAWIEHEHGGHSIAAEPQAEEGGNGEPAPTRPRFWKDDLGEIIILETPTESE